VIEAGDHVKVEFLHEPSSRCEWMWVIVEAVDRERRIVFGRLDGEPIAIPGLRLGMELAVSFDNIREHMKPHSFRQ
jgi:uncharacterized protein YegJ (DUF2314 family)